MEWIPLRLFWLLEHLRCSKWPKMMDNFLDILTLEGAGRQTVDTRSTFGSPWNLCGKTVLFLNCWWRGLQWNEFCSRASSWLMEKERMDGGWIVGAGHLQDHTVSQLLESAKRTFPVIVKFYSFSVSGQTSSDYLVERSKEHKRSHAWFTFCCESNESRSMINQ